MSDTVLVTGASGYIAGHCIVQLLGKGYRVRGTLRSLARADEVRSRLSHTRGDGDPGEALSFVQAELCADAATWDSAMRDVRYVLHVASPLPASAPKDLDELVIPARDGTLNVMRAAARASVERVVQTSSSSAAMYGVKDPNQRLFDERDWTDPAHRDNVPYTISKTVAEQAAWAELLRLPRKLEWVSILPGLVLGPVLDKDASASVAIIRKLMAGEIPGLPGFGWSIVDVRDIADLHLRAMETPGAADQRFIGSGDFVTMADMAAILKATLGARAAKVPTRRLPDVVVRLVGLFDKEVRGQLFELGKVRRPSSRKAMEQLGWAPRPARETIAATGESLIRVGAV